MQLNPSHIHSVFIPLTSLFLVFEHLNGQYFLPASSLVTNIMIPPLVPTFVPERRGAYRQDGHLKPLAPTSPCARGYDA
jgi:hypothetical protein